MGVHGVLEREERVPLEHDGGVEAGASTYVRTSGEVERGCRMFLERRMCHVALDILTRSVSESTMGTGSEGLSDSHVGMGTMVLLVT
jgi:hypothetical protein